MGNHRWYLATAAAAGAIFSLAACSSSKSPALSPSSASVITDVNDDAAGSGATAVSSTVANFGAAEGSTEANIASATPVRVASLDVPNATARTSCSPSGTTDLQTVYSNSNLDTAIFVRTWTFYAGATCQSTFSTTTTTEAAFATIDTSKLNGTNSHTHSYHSGAHNVLGDSTGGTTLLHAATYRVWNGHDDVTDTIGVTHTKYDVTYTLSAQDSAHNIAFAHPRVNAYPEAGMWSRAITGTATYSDGITGSVSVTRYVTVKFMAGTGGAGATQDTLKVYSAASGALMRTCLVDLSASAIVANSCH